MRSTAMGAAILIALALGACDGSEPTPEAGAEASPSAPGPSDCFQPSGVTLQALAAGITAEGATRNVTAIAAFESDELWYIAGELEGPDHEGGRDVAVWASTEDPGDEALEFTAVNQLAVEESDWEPEADIDEDDRGVKKVTSCVASGL